MSGATTFAQNATTSRTFRVSVNTIDRVERDTGVSLVDPFGAILERLERNPVLFVRVAASALALDVADARQFGEDMAGDAYLAAFRAFFAALVAFIPSPEIRHAAGAMLTQAWTATDQASSLAAATMTKQCAELSGGAPGSSV